MNWIITPAQQSNCITRIYDGVDNKKKKRNMWLSKNSKVQFTHWTRSKRDSLFAFIFFLFGHNKRILWGDKQTFTYNNYFTVWPKRDSFISICCCLSLIRLFAEIQNSKTYEITLHSFRFKNVWCAWDWTRFSQIKVNVRRKS